MEQENDIFNPSLLPYIKPDLHHCNWAEGAFILVDKPLTWTSFQAGNKIKYLLKRPKIGHCGTLDPLATGLLLFATGKFTKKLTQLTGLDKVYTGTITMGATTPSFDLETPTENNKDCSHITIEDVQKVLPHFTGKIQQYPPIFSAIKQNGKPIYHRARKGENVEVQPRNVEIFEFEITSFELPHIHFRVHCSSGTYIRSLANDVGAMLGVGAHLSALCRTQIGHFKLDDAFEMQTIIDELQIKPTVVE